jgi:hypothetical protein
MRTKVKANVPQWRDPETIKERYMRRCQQLHISSQFYHLSFEQLKDGLKMIFRKDPY